MDTHLPLRLPPLLLQFTCRLLHLSQHCWLSYMNIPPNRLPNGLLIYVYSLTWHAGICTTIAAHVPSKTEGGAADIGGSEAEAPGEHSRFVVANASAMYIAERPNFIIADVDGTRKRGASELSRRRAVGVKDMAPMSKDPSKEGMQPE